MIPRYARRCLGAALVACAAWIPAAGMAEQSWPTRAVQLLVPFPAGGGADAIGRLIGQKLGELWGQPVIIDNRPGASTMIGSDVVAKAAPDGYTLLLAVSNHTSNPALFAKMPYDTQTAFTPITLIGSAPMVLVVNPDVPARSTQELLALMRQKPGTFNYSSAGNGSVGHLAGELLKQLAGVDMVHVAYKGTAPAELDLVAGRVELMFTGIVTAIPQIKAGRMRGIAIGGTKRSSVLPDLPTVDEAGVPGFESSIWYGLLGPAGLPDTIAEKIRADVVKVLAEPAIRQKLLEQGIEATGSSPEQFRDLIASEISKFHELVSKAGIKSE